MSNFEITEFNSQPYAHKAHCWPIYRPKQGLINSKAMSRIFEQFEVMLSYHSRVFVFRIDLHPGCFNPTNDSIEAYLSDLISLLELEYSSQVRFICAREQNCSGKEHYHLVLMMNGDKVRYPGKLQTLVRDAWRKHRSGNSAHYVEHPYYMMKRGIRDTTVDAVYRVSYLAKEGTKQNNPSGIKGFFTSRNKRGDRQRIDKECDLLLVDAQQKSSSSISIQEKFVTDDAIETGKDPTNISYCNQKPSTRQLTPSQSTKGKVSPYRYSLRRIHRTNLITIRSHYSEHHNRLHPATGNSYY